MRIEQVSNDPTINLALDTIKKGKQAIVFASSKAQAEKTAEDISKKIKQKVNSQLAKQLLNVLAQPTKQCQRLARCIEKGIAFHHAGLIAKQRELIEDHFRSGNIKIICATPTLAAGVDLSAYRAIMKGLKRYSGRWGMRWIPTLEYMQMTGRAGRPSYDTVGEAISIAKGEGDKEQIKERFVFGEPEPVYSRLAAEPALRTYILSLIAGGFIRTQEDIIEFFNKTFWAHHYQDIERLGIIISKMLGLLEEWEFIVMRVSSSEFMSADQLGSSSTKMRATSLGKRVAELYLDPYTAHHLLIGLKRAQQKIVSEFALLQLISHTLEMRPLLRTGTKEFDLVQAALLEKEDELLDLEPTITDPEHEEFFNSIKTALFFSEWIEEKSEEKLMEELGIRPGEIRSKLALAEWLLFALGEFSRLRAQHSLISSIKKLRIRLSYGIREELVKLVRFKNIGRVLVAAVRVLVEELVRGVLVREQ